MCNTINGPRHIAPQKHVYIYSWLNTEVQALSGDRWSPSGGELAGSGEGLFLTVLPRVLYHVV